MKTWLAAFCVWLLAAVALRADPTPEAAATAVIYRRDDPASRRLAEYYAERRGIPRDQLVGVPCAADEEITRTAYTVTIEAPLRAAFDRSGWWQREETSTGARRVTRAKIRFLAIMRGVPLKIAPDPELPPDKNQPEPLASVNAASVDSELAALFAPRPVISGAVVNPYYRRFTRALDAPPAETPLFVARLDGPSDEIVRRMIDDALAAERDGLWGWAYLDARGIREGQYATGDRWLEAAATLLRRRGVPVIEDQLPETFDAAFSVRDAAIYYGWYSGDVDGPFARPLRTFATGAVAVHLHSFNARTLRDPAAAWAAPLLARGAAATFGNVYEPFLEFTVQFDALQDRLMAGMTLAEAGYAAMRAISWMGIVVGDPLYRPYARWNDLDAETPVNRWSRYRDIVAPAGGPLDATGELGELAVRTKDSMPLEALGQAQAAAGQTADALKTLRAAARLADPVTRFRLVLEEIEILRRAGRKDEARKRVADALGEFRNDDAQSALGRIVLALDPPPPTPMP